MGKAVALRRGLNEWIKWMDIMIGTDLAVIVNRSYRVLSSLPLVWLEQFTGNVTTGTGYKTIQFCPSSLHFDPVFPKLKGRLSELSRVYSESFMTTAVNVFP